MSKGNKITTIEQLFVEKYQKLEEENQVLEERQEKLLEINNNLGDERDEYKNKYNELIVKIKEDFGFELRPSSAFPNELIINSKVIVWENSDREKFEYYKNLFNLKEEGEDEEGEDYGK